MINNSLKSKFFVLVMITLFITSGQLFSEGALSQISLSNSFVDSAEFSDSGIGFNDVVQQTSRGAASARRGGNSLQIISFGFGSTGNDFADIEESGLVDALDDEAGIVLAVNEDPLVYPNPCSLRRTRCTLGYGLTKRANIDIHVYDMMGNRIYESSFNAGTAGAASGYNKIEFNTDVFNGNNLSAGVYFILLINEGTVLAKTKMAVIP